MLRLRWTIKALIDFDEAQAYIAHENPTAALHADLKQALRETRALQDRIRRHMGRVVVPRSRR